MPEFAYTAKDLSGQDVMGSISAANRREALATLTERSLFPLRVEDAVPVQARLANWFRARRRIKGELMATNLAQLADLLENGVSLLAALDVLAEQATHGGLIEVLHNVRDEVADGMSLDEAFARHPHAFSRLTVGIVRAGSEGAFLEDALRRTAGFLELQEELKSRVKGAMAYPSFLAVAGVVVAVVLVVFFVPKFAELFAQVEQHGGLPGVTIALLWLSDFLGKYGLVLAAGLVGLAMYLRHWSNLPRGREVLDRAKLKIPFAGNIFLSSAVSRFCRVLGTLLRNGVPLLKSLDISSESAGNSILAQAIKKSADNVSAGDTLAKPLADCGLFPRSVMAMMRVAEESNNLDQVLIKIADGVDRKISRQLDIMVRLIEPMMLMVMGGLILFVLVALLLPVFEMSSTIG